MTRFLNTPEGRKGMRYLTCRRMELYLQYRQTFNHEALSAMSGFQRQAYMYTLLCMNEYFDECAYSQALEDFSSRIYSENDEKVLKKTYDEAYTEDDDRAFLKNYIESVPYAKFDIRLCDDICLKSLTSLLYDNTKKLSMSRFIPLDRSIPNSIMGQCRKFVDSLNRLVATSSFYETYDAIVSQLPVNGITPLSFTKSLKSAIFPFNLQWSKEGYTAYRKMLHSEQR